MLWSSRRIPGKWLRLGCFGNEYRDTVTPSWLKIAAFYSAKDTMLEKLKEGVKVADVRAMGVP